MITIRNFKFILKSISSHILKVQEHSGHRKMIQNVTEHLQKSSKLKILDFAKMSPKMQQNTKNGDIFKKFASQRCKDMGALRQTLGLRVLLCIVGCSQLICLKNIWAYGASCPWINHTWRERACSIEYCMVGAALILNSIRNDIQC